LARGRIDVPDLIEDEKRDVKSVLAVRGDALRHPRRFAHVVERGHSPGGATRYALCRGLTCGRENRQHKHADNGRSNSHRAPLLPPSSWKAITDINDSRSERVAYQSAASSEFRIAIARPLTGVYES